MERSYNFAALRARKEIFIRGFDRLEPPARSRLDRQRDAARPTLRPGGVDAEHGAARNIIRDDWRLHALAL